VLTIQGIMNRKIPEVISARFALTSFAFRFAAILLVFALFAGCSRTHLDLDTVCFKWSFAEHRTFVVQSRERKPLTIQKIVLNGEYLIDRIDSDSGPQAFHAVTLNTGESASYVVNYSERVTYADIYSDRGICRCDLR
jgi:hypothetical protein